MSNLRVAAAVIAIAFLGACSTAPIALPAGLAATTQPLHLTGMGFGERGSFALGASSGSFVRHAFTGEKRVPFSSTRLTRSVGDGSFRVQGADFAGTVEGTCAYSEDELGSGGVSTTVSPFDYQCEFLRDGQPILARLALRAAPMAVGPLTAETRAGEILIGGRTIHIEPVHHMAGHRIAAGEPLGYRFVADGRDIGAVDLNGERKTIHAPFDGRDREAVLMASLALSVLWR
jgi:hypothetical protein